MLPALKKALRVAALAFVTVTPAAAHPPDELESFVGARVGQAEMGLQNLGYESARTKGRTGYWWNADEATCVAILTSNGRYKSIDIVKPSNCGKKVRSTSSPAISAVQTGQMPSFCAGEAAATFGVRPQNITTNMAFKSGDRYVSQGNFDRDGNTTFFNCWFGLDGSFQSVN